MRPPGCRLQRAFDATHTTSPAGTILASIDAALALLARDGEQLCGRLLASVAAAHETVPAGAAAGRVSAELAAPYPPGIPVLAPGEMITAGTVAALRAVRRDGGRVAYAADPTLATLQVVAGNPRSC